MRILKRGLVSAGLIFLAGFLVACGGENTVVVAVPTILPPATTSSAAVAETTRTVTTVAVSDPTSVAGLPSVTPIPTTAPPVATPPPDPTSPAVATNTPVSQGDPVLPTATNVPQVNTVLPIITAKLNTIAVATTAPVIKISPRPLVSVRPVISVVPVLEVGWKEYTYTQTNFSVQFPAQPVFSDTTESTAIGPFYTSNYTVKQTKEMTYTVSVVKQPGRVFNLLDPGGLLAVEKQKEQFLAKYRNFPKLSETPVFAGIYHGRRMNFEGGNGTLAFVYAIVAPRDSDFFVITVESTQATAENVADAKRFIESVKLQGIVYDWAQLNLPAIKLNISLPTKQPVQATFSETLAIGGVVKGTTYTALGSQGISWTVTALQYPPNVLAEDKISKSFNSQRDKLIGKLKAKISSQESITWANQYAGTYYDLDRPERGGFTKVQMFQKGDYIYILQLDSLKELPAPASGEDYPVHAGDYQRFFLSFNPQ